MGTLFVAEIEQKISKRAYTTQRLKVGVRFQKCYYPAVLPSGGSRRGARGAQCPSLFFDQAETRSTADNFFF